MIATDSALTNVANTIPTNIKKMIKKSDIKWIFILDEKYFD